MPGTLYLVATPIGNLGDISARAAQTLSDVDFIAAEDTRVTCKLLEHLGISKHLVSYYEYNQRGSGEKIVNRILSGENCTLVTDAGTPAISDPGEDIVRLCSCAGLPVVSIPGPCACIAALSLSGLPTGRFSFEGFLSKTRKNRFERLNELKSEKRTMVFYEAPHKLTRTLKDMLEVFGNRRISISRELTKLYDDTLRFTISEAVAHFGQVQPRGEFVLVIEGLHYLPEQTDGLDDAVDAACKFMNAGSSLKDAVKKASEEKSAPKNALYSLVIKQHDISSEN
jgi:16S rRNA (cytidine1402-2'-O)-methyltransferase